MTEQKKRTAALITGASSGLGAEFARLLDQALPRDTVLVLVALDECAAAFDRPVIRLACDLTESSARAAIVRLAEHERLVFSHVFCNAGIGRPGDFAELKPGDIGALLDINVVSTTLLAREMLPFMTKGSRLVLTASSSAFLPQPGFAVYAASKAYVYRLGRALGTELKKHGISVTVVCPGVMMTGFHDETVKEQMRHSIKRFGIEKTETVARRALRGAAKRKEVVVTSLSGKLLRLAGKILPTKWLLWVIEKTLR